VGKLKMRSLPALSASMPMWDCLQLFKIGRAHMAVLCEATEGSLRSLCINLIHTHRHLLHTENTSSILLGMLYCPLHHITATAGTSVQSRRRHMSASWTRWGSQRIFMRALPHSTSEAAIQLPLTSSGASAPLSPLIAATCAESRVCTFSTFFNCVPFFQKMCV
jgi:hypothetical protein